MPLVVHEFTRDQLALALGESRAAAEWLLTVAWHLGPVNTMGPNYRTGSPR